MTIQPRHARLARAVLAMVALFAGRAAVAQESQPADLESYERTTREERSRHLDVTRKLAEEEDRLRAALDAARGRLGESAARQAALTRLVAEAEGATKALQSRVAAANEILTAVRQQVVRGVARLGERAGKSGSVPTDLLRDGPIVRKLRLLLQVLDGELASARVISSTPRERAGAIGRDLRLGALATFFVPTAGGPVLIEPTGRALPEAVGVAVREIVRQLATRGRGTLVNVPWWGTP